MKTSTEVKRLRSQLLDTNNRLEAAQAALGKAQEDLKLWAEAQPLLEKTRVAMDEAIKALKDQKDRAENWKECYDQSFEREKKLWAQIRSARNILSNLARRHMGLTLFGRTLILSLVKPAEAAEAKKFRLGLYDREDESV